MKTTILLMFMLLISSIAQSQTQSFDPLPSFNLTPSQSPRYEVYNLTNGIREIAPTQTIINNNGNYDIYNNVNGLLSVFPIQTIRPTINGEYNVYKLINGLPSFLPTQTIIIK